MGEDLPGDPPIFEVDKYYCVTIAKFAPTCADMFVWVESCCKEGSRINTFFELWGNCNSEFCSQVGGKDIVIDSSGPYDTEVICQGVCP